MTNDNIELLAPVGDMESLYAAIQNGANAVYLGGKMFNARQYADNFSDEELKNAVEYAHIRDVKVYVTVNILLDDKEMKKALDYTKYLYEIDVDGLIVQDLGFSYLIKKTFPDFDLHGSTQMTINNLPGATFLEELGFSRVVLAREIPINEVQYIHSNSNVELEGFIHGALCVCYSGQCLMSSMLGGRSGNRGRCAQPCRMPYSFINYESGQEVFETWDKKYVLSLRDLNTLDYINEIIDSGIISLKIEGRMKRPEYVAIVVEKYRKVLDQGKESINQQDKNEVTQIFNRGFTKGYMLGAFGREAASYDRPDNRGLLVGKVVKIDKNDIYVKFFQDVEKGDGIEFETCSGDRIGIVLDFKGEEGKITKIKNIPSVLLNSEVYRTSSESLLKRARESYEQENIKYPINMKVFIYIGRPAVLYLTSENINIEVKSDSLVEKAKKVFLTKERIVDQLSKLNDTVYYPVDIQIELDENAFMSISDINKLRRDAIDQLNHIRKNKNNRKPISNEKYELLINKHLNLTNRVVKGKNKVSVSVKSKKQFDQLNLNKLDRIYIGFEDSLKDVLHRIKEKNIETYLMTDRILYRTGLETLKEKIMDIGDLLDGISVSNIGTFKFIRDNFDMNIHGEIGLNIFNSYTVKLLNSFGIKGVTLSPELNMKQIQNIKKIDGIIYESTVYGYIPLMITKHCPMALVKNCKDDRECNTCPYKSGFGLRDRKGIDFYMERDRGYTTIYNSVPLMVLEHIHQVFDCGIDMIRLDFTFEDENIREIQEIYYDYANNIIDYDMVEKYIKNYRSKKHITKGHYFRGVI